MKLTTTLFPLWPLTLLVTAPGALAQVCEWYLNPDDCICMLSTDGSLLRSQTAFCCKQLGYRTMNSVPTFPVPQFIPPQVLNIEGYLKHLDMGNGYRLTRGQICGVDRKNRQLFKDCCKGLGQESVIGHCR
ncbi:uncharacterized protein B0T23DRAFT_399809 [Neurospora hispaniola]|uniref:Uncharacterized protein n=1 Tax=Neurospora hispaniola TaxID=588809 RepID=A0AAJ0HYS8_9PEZI|nr:hypothetical protein B0T23DRAFT_399809 [Neurospora hispaniola]